MDFKGCLCECMHKIWRQDGIKGIQSSYKSVHMLSDEISHPVI